MRITSYKKILIRTFSLLILLAVTLVTLQSCYPGEELTYEDTDIVATFYDNATDFSTLLTYAMSDSVFQIDSNGDISYEDIGASNSQAIITATNNNLADMGFQKVADPNSADVLVEALVSSSTWVAGGCYSGYWSYWYPYYGWCYPTYYTYTTGTILIVMAEKQVSSTKGVWIAGINGLLSDINVNNTSRINQNINQAFDQSPYLGEGK